MIHRACAVPVAVRCLVVMVIVEAFVRGDIRTLAQRMGVPLQLDGMNSVYQPGRIAMLDAGEQQAFRVFWRLNHFWPTSTCLRRALVAGHLLRARGPRLVIGVRKPRGEALTAHAWLLLEGTALDEAALDYAPLNEAPKR